MIHKFHFHPHKILPLVYDESLSYYEFLCKVLGKLNEVIDKFNNEFEAKLEEIDADWGAFKDRITEELNTIIQQFEGDKQEIINQIKNEISEEIGEDIDAKLADAINRLKGEIAQEYATKAYSDQKDQDLKDYFNALISNRLFLYTTNLGFDSVLTYNHNTKMVTMNGEMSYIDSTDVHGLWSFPWNETVNLANPTPQGSETPTWWFLCIEMNPQTGAKVGLKAIGVGDNELLDFMKYRPLLRYDKNTGKPISIYAHFSNPNTNWVYT